jgi:16S rRNA (guanine(966)-N(2))-methyltransferase RsmD
MSVMRIISGELKGRKLKAPTWTGLRPTSDKLRETLFNVIAGRVSGARMIDLYAGTGAIGIEALSRGARHVTFVDDDIRAVRLIEENLRQNGISDRYAIIRFRLSRRQHPSNLPRSLGAASFDLVVLDPPYDEPDLAACVAFAEPLVAAGGLLVLEHARRSPVPEHAGRLVRTRDLISGDSALAFYESAVNDQEPVTGDR